ncbi:MAG: deoxyribodipyrimidine photo-lyase [Saprospiraceae bacterium]|nr:deoxyribodipyrimidine photo-lyase [Saprospiraceae bacterium]
MQVAAFWFRRDLRLNDNAGLYHALKSAYPVLCFFIFDKIILDKLSNKSDSRVNFIFDQINLLQKELQALGSSLIVGYGDPHDIWKDWLNKYSIREIYYNRDYESYALQRDLFINNLARSKNIQLYSFKDHVLFEKNELCKSDNSVYKVFTPFKNSCIKKLTEGNTSIQESSFLKPFPNEKYYSNFAKINKVIPLTLESIGFLKSNQYIPSTEVSKSIIKNYHNTRDYPYLNGTSKLGIHFRFGTISIREKARNAFGLNTVYVNELLWRDFYSIILQAFPYVEKNAFKPNYDYIEWINDETQFAAWCNGATGFPIVDAGMRELNSTGYMHNRVRMIVASFLVKNLLIDWRWGEAYFAEKLLDFDLASNNGGWQWASGSGTDAAPYFRIFNPQSQQEKFDPEFKYIKKWVPEYGTDQYPKPIIDYKSTRERCLKAYSKALQR